MAANQEPFCCNPRCKRHEKEVHPDTGEAHFPDGKVYGREEVVRTVSGVEIRGKFCNVCLNVINMFGL